MNDFKMGAIVRCTLTNFQGRVTARVDYINGTRDYRVQPAIGEDKKYIEAVWVDAGQLVLM